MDYAFLLRKIDCITFEAFRYHSGGQGRYVKDKPVFDAHPAKLYLDYSFDLSGVAVPDKLPMVSILHAHHGAGPGLFEAAGELGARAVILDGIGAGSWPTESLRVIEELARLNGIYVIFASQSPYGFVDKRNSCGSMEAGQCRVLIQLNLWLQPRQFGKLYDAGQFRGHVREPFGE